MKIKLLGIFIIVCCGAANASMIGDSHNVVGAVGRARANVVYNPAQVASVAAPVETIASDAPDVIAMPEPEIIPEPETIPTPEMAPDLTDEIAMATEYLAQLQAEIGQIDSEIARCKRAKNNWTIGTVIGGVGVVGATTGAIVQAVQINKEKQKNAQSDAESDAEEGKEKSE